MKIKKELIKREIAGDVILVPVGRTALENNGLFTLNELGGFLWDRLPEARDETDLLRAVLAEYDVTESQAMQDIREFLEELKNLGIL